MDSEKQFTNMFGDFIKTKLIELIEHYFDDHVEAQPATLNKKQIVKMTGVSVATLDANFFSRADVLAAERPYGSKRLWRYPEVRELWINYLDERYYNQFGVLPPKIQKSKAQWTVIYKDRAVKNSELVLKERTA